MRFPHRSTVQEMSEKTSLRVSRHPVNGLNDTSARRIHRPLAPVCPGRSVERREELHPRSLVIRHPQAEMRVFITADQPPAVHRTALRFHQHRQLCRDCCMLITQTSDRPACSKPSAQIAKSTDSHFRVRKTDPGCDYQRFRIGVCPQRNPPCTRSLYLLIRWPVF